MDFEITTARPAGPPPGARRSAPPAPPAPPAPLPHPALPAPPAPPAPPGPLGPAPGGGTRVAAAESSVSLRPNTRRRVSGEGGTRRARAPGWGGPAGEGVEVGAGEAGAGEGDDERGGVRDLGQGKGMAQTTHGPLPG